MPDCGDETNCASSQICGIKDGYSTMQIVKTPILIFSSQRNPAQHLKEASITSKIFKTQLELSLSKLTIIETRKEMLMYGKRILWQGNHIEQHPSVISSM